MYVTIVCTWVYFKTDDSTSRCVVCHTNDVLRVFSVMPGLEEVGDCVGAAGDKLAYQLSVAVE